MSDPASPRRVLESLLQGISDGHWNDLADLYAEDAVVQQPFAPTPPRRLEGREAIRAHFAAAAQGPLRLETSNVVVHDTADPEVVIAEFDYDGRVATTGRTFRVANIQVLRVRDGRIVSSRDYHITWPWPPPWGGFRHWPRRSARRSPHLMVSHRQLHPLVVPQDSQTKQEPAGRIRTPQVEQ